MDLGFITCYFSHACRHEHAIITAQIHLHMCKQTDTQKQGNPGPSCFSIHTWPAERGVGWGWPTASALNGGWTDPGRFSGGLREVLAKLWVKAQGLYACVHEKDIPPVCVCMCLQCVSASGSWSGFYGGCNPQVPATVMNELLPNAIWRMLGSSRLSWQRTQGAWSNMQQRCHRI